MIGAQVGEGLLEILRAEPILGRLFTPAEHVSGQDQVALISHPHWISRRGGDPEILGKTVRLEGSNRTIVGVLPPGFSFIQDGDPEIWVPFAVDPRTAERGSHDLIAVGRLAKGVSVAAADRDVKRVAAELATEFPDSNEGWSASVIPMSKEILGDVGGPATMSLMIAVGFLLLMACTNLANLLLAKGHDRGQEMGVRAALGAGRFRLVAQLLTESLLLAVIGGAAGIGIAVLGNQWILAKLPAFLPGTMDLGVDGNVLWFAVALSLFTALLFGLLPAVRTSRRGVAAVHGRGSERRRRFGGSLVVAQSALAVALLVGGGLMAKSVVNLQTSDFGFEREGVLTAIVSPPATRYAGSEAIVAFYDELRVRVAALPGVLSVGTIRNLPASGSNNVGTVRLEGDEDGPANGYPVRFEYISPGYNEAMRISVLRGRDVAGYDIESAVEVALVNESFARRALSDRDPVGAVLLTDGDMRTEIVGVIGDVHERNVNAPPEPAIYYANRQLVPRTQTLAIRTAGDPVETAPALLSLVREMDPLLPVTELRTLESHLQTRMAAFEVIGFMMRASPSSRCC